MNPKRIQRKRTKGWRMPEGAVYVGRPTKWGNPYRVFDPHPDHGWPMSRGEAVALFIAALDDTPGALGPRSVEVIRRELRGRDLVCWCPLGQPCHADVLLELANP